jgi:hypothetical protein
MMTSHTSDRKYTENGVEYCFCTKHNAFEPCTEFSPRPNKVHGYYYYCRKCVTGYQKLYREKKERLIVEDGIEKCFCTQHDEYHPCENFQRSKANHGYQYNCRDIVRLQMVDTGTQFARVNERTQAFEMLSLIGYDTSGEVSIHEQFKQKYNL